MQAEVPAWVGVVGCCHRAVLARTETAALWTRRDCCGETPTVDGWQIGISAATATDALTIRRQLTRLRTLDLPVGATLVRLTREPLTRSSVLLADGESVAALTWGYPLGLIHIAPHEYAITNGPHVGAVWRPLQPGTLVALDECGPTYFPIPFDLDLEHA